MKLSQLLFVFLFTTILSAQTDLDKIKKEIMKEAFLLYESEKASWHGSDLFMKKYSDKATIGGYFSYTTAEKPTCIFYSNDKNPKVIGTISFDKTFNLNNATVDLKSRNLSPIEQDYVEINNLAKERIRKDTIFKFYENTNYNFIPLIQDKVKRVYIITASNINGNVIFGNDYLLSFDKKNKITKTERLHRGMLSFKYGDGVVAQAHNHLKGFSDFATATDLCTTMLYQHYAGWENHYIVSSDYISIWDCKKNDLILMKYEDWAKTQE